jgi:hypothetical protein
VNDTECRSSERSEFKNLKIDTKLTKVTSVFYAETANAVTRVTVTIVNAGNENGFNRFRRPPLARSTESDHR